MPPAARITDMHMCPMVTPGIPPIPHVGGPVVMGSANVLTGKMPQARVGDMAVCVGPPDTIAKGSAGVMVNKMPAARLGDITAHGGSITVGYPTVIIGEIGGGGGGASAGAAGAGKVAIDFAEVKTMLLAFVEAARDGTPFCEICFKAALKRAGVPS